MEENLVLYRKYRPKTFSEVVGQEHIVRTLTNAIASGMVSHAYLFSGPRGSGKCVKFDTKIVDTLTGKIFTIEETYKQRKVNLLTLQSNYKLRKIQPSKYIDDGIKPCHKVTTALGREIEVTLSHPFLTIDGWKKLSELKIGDYIGIPRMLPTFGKEEMLEYQVRLIAHLISEGSTYDPNGSIGFTNSDHILVSDFRSAAKKFENIKVVKYDSGGTRTPTYRAVQITCRYWINQPGQSKNSIMGFAKSLGLVGQKSKTKTIPSVIFQLNKSLLSLFLRTLYSGDGGVDLSSRSIIYYYSSSKQLIYQIQHLLLRFGIIARVRYKPVKFRNRIYPSWALDITNRESLLLFIKEIGFIGEKKKKLQRLSSGLVDRPTNPNCDVIPLEVWNLVKREKEINNKSWVEIGKILNYKKPKKFSSTVRFRPSRNKLKICGEVFGSQEILNIANSDIYWDRITEIKYTGNYQVYDLVVPETHNFVANDFIVHNTTVARLLAKAVNCSQRQQSTTNNQQPTTNSQQPTANFEPCNKCSSCVEINQGRAIDLIEIDAASNRGIDDMRSLREGVRFAPTKLPYKVFVIDECQQLTKEAANALLKTLEEPPSHTIFVLATTEIHKMIPTIISRCQRFDFRKLTLAEIVRKLEFICQKEKKKIEKSALELIALNSSGALRDAETLLDQAVTFSDKGEIKAENIKDLIGLADINLVAGFVDLLCQKELAKTLDFLNEEIINNKGQDPQQFARALVSYLRQLLLFKMNPILINPVFAGLTREQGERLKGQASFFQTEEAHRLLRLVLGAENRMKYSAIPQLPLELAIIEAFEPGEKIAP